MQFNLSLLGSFEATCDGRVLPFATSTTRALLAYIAMESHRSHAREALATLFWPNHTQAAAYTNLRQTLAHLRKALQSAHDGVACVTITAQRVQFQAEKAVLDVTQWLTLLEQCATHTHTNADALRCAECIARLEQAASLYRGDLLDDLFLEQSQLFSEWLFVKREAMHRYALDALALLTRAYEVQGAYEHMRHYATRQLALEPWREEAHAELMRALACMGQRTAALAQYDVCRRVLAAELGVEPSADVGALYEQIRAGTLRQTNPHAQTAPILRMLGSPLVRQLVQPLPTAASAPSLRPRPPHNLPAQPVLLIGRAQEVTTIRALIQQDDVRLLTLSGPGGVGKTGLAIHVAHDLLYHATDVAFADGICFVDLSTVHDAALVPQAIAGALALRDTGDTPLTAQLTTYLHERRLLLVLDNFEHVLAAAAQISELLAGCAYLKVLVTSRTALGHRTEHIFPVLPLALPLVTPTPQLESLAASPAVVLFVERAQSALPGFQLLPTNLAAVAAICVRLDGLPLAIELAAARLRFFAPHELLDHLTHNGALQLLGKSAHQGGLRQQTMRNTIAWSYHLLPNALQSLFAQLGVFVGVCTVAAIEAICDDRSWNEETNIAVRPPATLLLDELEALLDQSMLRQEPGADGIPRFTMLETLRAYALEQLQAHGLEDRLRRQHALYYLAFAEQAESQLQGVDQTMWLDRLEAEHDNIRAALHWADVSGERAIGLRLAAALGEFWWPRGYLSEGRRWLALFLKDQDNASDQPHLQPYIAKALYRAGELAYGQGVYPAALELLDHSRARYASFGDTHGLACVLRGIGNGYAGLGRDYHQEATRYRLESVALFRQVGDMWGVAWVSLEMGQIEPNSVRQEELFEESLALARAGGYLRIVATALVYLSRMARSKAAYTTAARLLREAVVVGQSLRDSWLVASASLDLGVLVNIQGETAQAQALYEEAIALSRAGGHEVGVAFGLDCLGDLLQRTGELARAEEVYAESIEVFRRLGDLQKCAEVRDKIAHLASGAHGIP